MGVGSKKTFFVRHAALVEPHVTKLLQKRKHFRGNPKTKKNYTIKYIMSFQSTKLTRFEKTD